ncbi:MAG: hypothetical protein HYR56_00440 [Acidobacteria bacterium]|nr:hypothetical protein [Acidobacteriota bacterium]MBI3421577.1 hypothetical protein [Acidobacteriota bacterium]
MTKSKFINAALLFCALIASTTMTFAQHGPDGSQGQTRDPLGALKRALTQASAPALTTQQETDINALITAFKAAQPTDGDATLEAARDAFDAALLAGNLTAAQTQATAIATRQAQLSDARLKTVAKFVIGALTILKNGGQLDALKTKFGDDRTLQLVESLAGGGFGGGH